MPSQELLEFLNEEHVALSEAWINAPKKYVQKRRHIKRQVRSPFKSLAERTLFRSKMLNQK